MGRYRLMLIACLAIAAGVTTFGVWIRLPPRPGITRENYNRIALGMTKTEVIEILGCEPHYQPNEALPQMNLGFTVGIHIIQTQGCVWESNQGRIYVVFNDGKVSGKMRTIEHFHETFFEQTLRWLRLQ